MTEPENPLSRWSRLKRAAKKERNIQPAARAPSPHADASAAQTFDPASLPPIDSIAAGTDIRAFLQSGVPTILARAALRRAWVSEPAIRDFIGIAENQWDFTDPTAIPGFGPLLETDDMPGLVAQAVGTFDKSSEASEDTTASVEEAPPAMHDPLCGTAGTVVQQTGDVCSAQTGQVGMAARDGNGPAESGPRHRRRPHGSALPK